MAEPRTVFIGIDTGGTYTDAVVYDDDRGEVLAKAKSPTTHDDLAVGIEGALDRVLADAAVDPAAVGLVSLMLRPQQSVIGLGYWVVPSARQRGLARRAVALASDWAIGAGGYARIEAWVEPDNLPSQAVLLAAGFELEGRLRSFLAIGDSRSDALVYSRLAATDG